MARSSLEKPSLIDLVAEFNDSKPLKKSGKHNLRLDQDFQIQLDAQAKDDKDKPSLLKSILRDLNAPGSVERLAFEVDPSTTTYGPIYKAKSRLLPDKIIKRILIQDDLVAAIVQARQNHLSAFGRPRPDRHSKGFVIEARQETLEKIEKIEDPNKKQEINDSLRKRIASVSARLMTCGDPNSLGQDDRLTFPQYLSQSCRNAVGLGRIATEVIQVDTPEGKKFNCFRVIDAGTIYRARPQRSAAAQVRKQAKFLLERIKNKKLIPERYQNDEYAWIQVIEDRPVQAFTADECLVHNFYPVPDYEMDGYPVTPLDTIISAVTMHINITTHNKVYFASGRAAKGMLVIQSDDVDEHIVSRVRQQFNASINSVQNAHRMPVFGVGAEDSITWQPIDSGGKDMEFQYLSDMNARIILSAFQMSPDELPGWGYLSRGTSSQALSESNEEYKLTAARDVGIRPLLAQFEDFLNAFILPLFDKTLAEMCVIKLVGLDAETAEKTDIRLQEASQIHMTFDEVLGKVEKNTVGKKMGGEFPLNPQFQAVLDKYVPVGVILEHFFDVEGASKDPTWAYVRDPFWIQNQQMIQMMQQQQAQQQAGAQGGMPPGGPEGSGGAPPADGGPQEPSNEPAMTENQKNDQVDEASASPEPAQDLTRSLDQAIELLNKSEKALPPSKRRVLQHQKMLVEDFIKGWGQDLKEVQDEIIGIASKLKPKA